MKVRFPLGTLFLPKTVDVAVRSDKVNLIGISDVKLYLRKVVGFKIFSTNFAGFF